MGLNQGIPALRNNTTQALGHNPQDILVSKSGVATPSTPSNHPQEGLRRTGPEGEAGPEPGSATGQNAPKQHGANLRVYAKERSQGAEGPRGFREPRPQPQPMVTQC